MTQAQVRTRRRLACRLRRIDANFEVVARAYDVGEHAKLADRATALAFDACARQAGFRDAAVDQFVAEREDVCGDRVEERRARFGLRFAIRVECGPGERTCVVEIDDARATERRLHALAAGCIDRVRDAVRAAPRVRADQQVACDSHFRFLSR